MLARALSPVFTRLFPDIPKNHPVMGSIFMNIASNMLGLDNIAQDCPEMKPFEEINVVYEDQAAVAELQTEMLEKWTNLLTK